MSEMLPVVYIPSCLPPPPPGPQPAPACVPDTTPSCFLAGNPCCASRGLLGWPGPGTVWVGQAGRLWVRQVLAYMVAHAVLPDAVISFLPHGFACATANAEVTLGMLT